MNLLNTGHGHVFPRPDGARARCGGPAICAECARDQIIKDQREEAKAVAAYTLHQIIELLPLTEQQKQTMTGEQLVAWLRDFLAAEPA